MPTNEIWENCPCSSSSDRPSSRHLGVAGGPQVLGLQFGVGLLDSPRFGPHRTRHPVDAAQLVDDGALDAGDGVRLELDGPLVVELLDGVNQAEDAVAHEVGLLDGVRQANRDPAGDVLDQGRVADDQLVPQLSRAGPLVLGPQFVGGKGLRFSFHQVVSPSCGGQRQQCAPSRRSGYPSS